MNPIPLRRTALPFALLLPALGVAGCEDGRRTVQGHGALVQQRREFRSLEGVVIEAVDGIGVTVVVGPGEGPEAVVWVSGSDDLLGYVETRVEPAGSDLLAPSVRGAADGSGSGLRTVLRIGIVDGVRLEPLPEVEVRLPRLLALEVTGAGNVRLDHDPGAAPSSLSLRLRGSTRIAGRGLVDRLTVLGEGSGDAHLLELVARAARYENHGSGDGWVTVVEDLEVVLHGSGDLFVAGEPRRTVAVNGSGEVRSAAR